MYKLHSDAEMDKEKQVRKEQMGTGALGEKIRTYNWPNNRITDHRTGAQKFGIDQMFEGELLQEFIDELIDREREQRVKAFLQ